MNKMSEAATSLFCLALIIFVTGCAEMAGGMSGAPATGAPSGEFGATQGGVQDMGLARELILNDQVPPPEAFSVEGMFSEHDLPLAGEPCDRLLCLRGAAGLAPTLTGNDSAWFQLGMSSTIDPQNYQRPALSLIVTVDVSGSMGWTYSSDRQDYVSPSTISRRLLTLITDQLGAQDRVAMVTYGSKIKTTLAPTRGDNQPAIDQAIADLTEAGSTNMEAGMRRAFQLARDELGSDRQVRVMVFTDVQPNVGATSASEFEQLAAAAAGDDIALTVMGMGVGLGQDVLNRMVHLRGGNAFSLFDKRDADRFMEDDWPWAVCPIAYNLSVSIRADDGFQVADAYGFPGDQADSEASFDVTTVFLSRRKGALLLRFAPAYGRPINDLRLHGNLNYLTPDGEEITQSLEINYPEGPLTEQGRYFEQASVGKTVALAILVANMKQAAELYQSNQAQAVTLMNKVVTRIRADAEPLDDLALQVEVELAERLLALMTEGAPQGDLYGQR